MQQKPATLKNAPGAPNFAALVQAISDVHLRTQGAAAKAINVALTCRNWLIGAYIHEYEFNGRDRAGERLIDRLAEALRTLEVPSSDRQRLYAYTAFFRIYPQIDDAIPGQWKLKSYPSPSGTPTEIFRSPTGKSSRTTFRTGTGRHG